MKMSGSSGSHDSMVSECLCWWWYDGCNSSSLIAIVMAAVVVGEEVACIYGCLVWSVLSAVR